MIVGGQTEARAQLSSTIIDYHEPFDQGFTFCARARSFARANDANIVRSRDAQCKTRESP